MAVEYPASDDELDKLMKPLANDPAIFQIDNEPVVQQRNAFKPFYRFVELERYRMYFDPKHPLRAVVKNLVGSGAVISKIQNLIEILDFGRYGTARAVSTPPSTSVEAR